MLTHILMTWKTDAHGEEACIGPITFDDFLDRVLSPKIQLSRKVDLLLANQSILRMAYRMCPHPMVRASDAHGVTDAGHDKLPRHCKVTA